MNLKALFLVLFDLWRECERFDEEHGWFNVTKRYIIVPKRWYLRARIAELDKLIDLGDIAVIVHPLISSLSFS